MRSRPGRHRRCAELTLEIGFLVSNDAVADDNKSGREEREAVGRAAYLLAVDDRFGVDFCPSRERGRTAR